jgi:predicted amidohydrolase
MDDLSLPTMHQLGSDRGRGNLLGIEPFMTPQDYAGEKSFFDKLNGYLLTAQSEKYLNAKSIVLFPEYLGTWLVLASESERIIQATTFAAAEKAMVFRHLLLFLSHVLKSKEKNRMEAAFFRMKAPLMAEIYQNVFSRLARQYSVPIVAGSIVLPAPQIESQNLVVHDGPLYNTSVVFRPDGTPYPALTRKVFPTARELPFTTPASVRDIPSFDTALGRLGVLVCADSWFPQAYAALEEQEIDMLAVPSCQMFDTEGWSGPWHGYDGWPLPADVEVNDVRHITEAQAWNKYSLAGRIRASGAGYGMNIFLRGKLWDQDLGGWPATLVRGTEVFVEEPTQRAAILSLWL